MDYTKYDTKYYILDFNTKTDRKFIKLIISEKDIYQQRIDMNRIDFSSIKFENMPSGMHILACWYDFSRSFFVFIVEHENFLRIPEGVELETYNTKIIDYIGLIKLPKNL